MCEETISPDKIKIRRITSADLKVIYPRLKEVYSKTGFANSTISKLLYGSTWKESVVAEVDGKIAGFYFVSRRNIPFYKPKKLKKLNKEFDFDDYDILVNGEGLEGIALGVFPEFKEAGVGKKLIEYPSTLYVDYVWGYQVKSLDNIKDWLKRRKLYADVGFYITYQIFDDSNDNRPPVADVMGEADVHQIYQPNGYSCGPTCLAMVKNFVMGEIPSIDDICKECGTDMVVGTPPDRMRLGLKYLKINYKEHIGTDIDPYENLKRIVDEGNVAIIRTIIGGPHWIIVSGYKDDIYLINDPWQGEIQYTKDELEEFWEVRDYFCFEILK
jgi:GNAT superfamily N-acetyltransferase